MCTQSTSQLRSKTGSLGHHGKMRLKLGAQIRGEITKFDMIVENPVSVTRGEFGSFDEDRAAVKLVHERLAYHIVRLVEDVVPTSEDESVASLACSQHLKKDSLPFLCTHSIKSSFTKHVLDPEQLL